MGHDTDTIGGGGEEPPLNPYFRSHEIIPEERNTFISGYGERQKH